MVEVYKLGGSIETYMKIIEYDTLSVNRRDFVKNVFRIRIVDKTRYP